MSSKMIVHAVRLGSHSLEHTLVSSGASVRENDNMSVICLEMLVNMKLYDPKNFGKHQEAYLEEVIEYLEKGNKCACYDDRCEYKQENREEKLSQILQRLSKSDNTQKTDE